MRDPAATAAPADDALVRRHYPWVRAAAMRQVRDAHLADDVAQAVFIVLMRKKPALKSEAQLAGWLFQTVRYAAAHALRSQRRRVFHEARAAQAAEVRVPEPSLSTADWEEIAPLLDESVARLRRDDRQAVLLRFYQQKSFGEVGAAMGISEEAARKRVNRAVDKLRDALSRRGVVVPAGTALATMLMTHATPAATAPLIASAVTGTTGAAAKIAKGIAMTWTPAKIAAVALAAALAVPAVATVGYLSLESRSAPAPAAATVSGAEGGTAAETNTPAAPSAATQPVSQLDPIIPDDLLEIAISDLVGPGIVAKQRSRVDPESNITLPLIGGVSVKDLTLDQAERAAQKAYRDQNLMPNAQIDITRVESGKAPSTRWARGARSQTRPTALGR